jgi:23S rRNA pseudouridine1911/1915/1917 synthase
MSDWKDSAMKKRYNVSGINEGQRVDVFLSSETSLSRSHLQHLINSGNVKVNGRAVKPGYRLKRGDTVNIVFVQNREPFLTPEPIDIDIVYRDEHLIVVNKPPGMVMYPAAGHYGGTLMNAVANISGRLASIGRPLRPGVVHRIDKDTSGLVVIAFTDEAYYSLVRQFKDRAVKRDYIALVYGWLREDSGEIDLPIGRSVVHRKKMSTRTRRGRPAKTFWRVLERYDVATLVSAKLATGRTHQIRVHFSATGHPVLGDKIYGRKTLITVDNLRLRIPRQMLHAESIGFVHPHNGVWCEFHAPMPGDMRGIVDRFRRGMR